MNPPRTVFHRKSGLPALAAVLLGCLLAACAAFGAARQVDEFTWAGVDRIVAVGDVHGDYEQYREVLQSAGLVDRRGKWTGGDTHLVQTGDIPDRGPDSRRIIDHLQELKKQARRKGGHVHTLIGNHDAMNVYGDLRYVHAGEFEAFSGRNSARYRELQWQHHLETLKERDPEGFETLDVDAFRAKWEKDHPLGWVEHRQAWSVEGEYGSMVLDNPVAVKINDTLFVHGGLSAKFCQATLEELTGMVHAALEQFDYLDPGIIVDELGPLWYRGLANDDEQRRAEMVSAILERYDAGRIVVGHTPTRGIVWPRFEGRVILNDTGISAYYGGYNAFLELTGDGRALAHYGDEVVELPASGEGRIEYLKQVIALNPGNAHLQSRLQKMLMARNASAPAEPEAEEAPESEAGPAGERPMTEEEVRAAQEVAQREAWLSPDNCR